MCSRDGGACVEEYVGYADDDDGTASKSPPPLARTSAGPPPSRLYRAYWVSGEDDKRGGGAAASAESLSESNEGRFTLSRLGWLDRPPPPPPPPPLFEPPVEDEGSGMVEYDDRKFDAWSGGVYGPVNESTDEVEDERWW